MDPAAHARVQSQTVGGVGTPQLFLSARSSAARDPGVTPRRKRGAGGKQGRAGAAGVVRPRRRGRRWLKKTFSGALAERRPALWVEVRRTEAAGRAGVEGEVGRCGARDPKRGEPNGGAGRERAA